MPLSQIVRDRFDEIVEWRSHGISWKDIDGRLRGSKGGKSPMSLRNFYFKELAIRRSQERIDLLDWIDSHFHQIQDLRLRGYDWAAVHKRASLDEDTAPSLIEMIAEFGEMKKRRAQSALAPSRLREETAKECTGEDLSAQSSTGGLGSTLGDESRFETQVPKNSKKATGDWAPLTYSSPWRGSDGRNPRSPGASAPSGPSLGAIRETLSKPSDETYTTPKRPREIALSFLASPSQRQLVDYLADMQALDEDHPIWGIVAMLGAVISGEGSSRLDLGELGEILATESDLKAATTEVRMLRSEIHGLRSEIQKVRSDIRSLASQTSTSTTELKDMHVVIETRLSQIGKVINDAAHLNSQMPKFLESLRMALTPKDS